MRGNRTIFFIIFDCNFEWSESWWKNRKEISLLVINYWEVVRQSDDICTSTHTHIQFQTSWFLWDETHMRSFFSLLIAMMSLSINGYFDWIANKYLLLSFSYCAINVRIIHNSIEPSIYLPPCLPRE